MEWWQAAIALLAGTILPVLATKFIPNSTFKAWGVSVGSKLTTEGRKIAGKEAWEKLEGTIVGSFVAFSDGLKEGAESDNNL